MGWIFEPLGQGRWRFAHAEGSPVFQVPKPPDTYRIFCFGESATMGAIYNPQSTFPKLLQEMLLTHARHGSVEVINCGTRGINSTTVNDFFEAALELDPDEMVIYCGNNELAFYKPVNPAETPFIFPILKFLEQHSAVFRAARHLVRITRAKVGGAMSAWAQKEHLVLQVNKFPAARREAIQKNFLLNMETMIRAARTRKVPVRLCTVAVNWREWPPQKSRYPDSMPLNRRVELEDLARQAEEALQAGRHRESARLIAAIMVRDPEHARGHFLEAKEELATGNAAAARTHFLEALDLNDSRLFRAPSYQNLALLRLAAQEGVPMLDLARVFDERSPQGMTGFELMDDMCHPTLEGQVLIAAELAAAIAADHPDRFEPVAAEDLIARQSDWLDRMKVTPEFLAERIQGMAFCLAFQFDDRQINEQAVRLLGRLQGLVPESTLPDLLVGLLRLRQDQAEAGQSAFAAALRRSPEHVGRMEKFYLHSFLRWRDPYLWVQAKPGTSFLPVLDIYLAAAGKGPKKPVSPLSLDRSDRIYYWKSETRSLTEITDDVKSRIALRFRFRPSGLSAGKPVVIFDPSRDQSGPQRHNLEPRGDTTFLSLGPDPYFVFAGLSLPAALIAEVRVRLEITPLRSPLLGKVCLYWQDRRSGRFSEERKSCVAPEAGATPSDYRFDLADDPDWILSDEVEAIRLDPTEGLVEVMLTRIEAIPWQAGASAE
ncbi:MAG: hypothetical protein A2V67_14705 [Deltaproteobacteria bacterium RBG_13_61_14]|nr:MAG: hypothetical protein A2V67_14705 [Deltaproteobacteria bacterium RBG_13_61_14]